MSKSKKSEPRSLIIIVVTFENVLTHIDNVFNWFQLYDFVLSDDEMGALLKLDKNMRTFLLAM